MFDIHELPKEALFTLFLQIEPEEIKTVCFSRNKKVREICNSNYFQQAYGQKYRKVDFSGRKDLTKNDFKSLIGSYSINLSYTNVTDEDLKYLSNAPKLFILTLTYTNVTDEGLKYLPSIPNLSTLNLSYTNVTDEGLKISICSS